MSVDADDDERRNGMRRTIAVLWPSFMVAALAEFVIFALLDPAAMHLPGGEALSRPAAYTVGFFVFWALGALSSGLTIHFAQDGTPAAPRPADTR